MEEAKCIVKLLNAPPLDLGISVLEFCQKTPMQLRQLLYQVLSTILAPQRIDDTFEAKTRWMMELIRVLNYRPNIDGITLREGIVNGSTYVIYQLLSWLLSQIPMLQKRAYLAHFLVDVEIPAELLLEEDMNILHAQCNNLREQFKATHQHMESLCQIDRDPNKVKQQVQDLERERDHLQSKILKVKGKLHGIEKVEIMLDMVSQLKTHRAEENSLGEALKEQKLAMTNTLSKYQNAASKLQKIQTLIASISNPTFIQNISQENSILHYNSKEKLPKELETKQLHLCALQEVLVVPNKPDGLASIQAKLLLVNEEIRLLRRKHGLEKVQQNGDESKEDVLQWQQAQMGVIIANKTQEAFDKFSTLTIRKQKLLKELDQKNVAIEEVKATVRHGDDFKQYVDMLRSKSATCKRMKKEIDELAAEYGVLLRTQQLLEQQQTSTSNYLNQKEMTNLGEVDNIEMKNSAKNLKKSIVEVSTLVKEIRCKLAPQVKELKLLRTDLQGLGVEYAEQIQHYNDVRSLTERKVAKLEADNFARSKEFEIETQAWKDNESAIEKLQASVLQLNMEKQDGEVSAEMNARIEQQEELMNNLHKKQQKLKETEHSNLVQMTMMKDLLTLFVAKLTLYSSGSKPAIFSTSTSLETVDK